MAVTAVRVLEAGRETMCSEGPVSGGTRVRLLGSGLFGLERILIGSAAATDVWADISPSYVDVTTPAATAPGPVRITIVNKAGSFASAQPVFTYVPDAGCT